MRPVTAEECRRAAGEIFDRLLAAQHEGADCFVVKSRDERIRVPYRKILYFEARERRLCLRMAGEELTFTARWKSCWKLYRQSSAASTAALW